MKFNNIVITLLLLLAFASPGLATEQVFYYITDPAGTPLAMTDEKGDVVWTADYKPFGEEHAVSGTADNSKRFVGKEKDEETGLSYFGARYEDARTGRFIAVDPVRVVDPMTSKTNEKLLLNPQRLNVYAYALNNPYRYVDPDGREAIQWAGPLAVMVSQIDSPFPGPADIVAGGIIGLALLHDKLNNNTETQSNLSAGGTKSYKTKSNAGPKAADAPGQTASGQATDNYGNTLGPSGEPMIHGQKYSTRKGAKDAARNEGQGAPVHHPTPVVGDRHFHPSGRSGNKKPGSTHHEY